MGNPSAALMISAVRRARCSGLAKTAPTGWPAIRDAASWACASPSSLNGTSLCPCTRRAAFQVDSPWRTKKKGTG